MLSAAPDGKRYDAYVSFLPPGAPRAAETLSPALQVLSEQLERQLERQHGYSLYIRGRDDRPGEGWQPGTSRDQIKDPRAGSSGRTETGSVPL